MLQPYPESEPSKVDLDAEAEIDWMMQFVLGVRKIKGEMNVAPGKRVTVLLWNTSESDRIMLEANRNYIEFLSKTDSITVLSEDHEKPESAMTLLGEMNILIPLEGLIDKEAEIDRLSKAMDKIEKDIARLEVKIGNPGFVRKAPHDVVDKERQKLADNVRARDELAGQIGRLAN
jgi:valyl-tRNA synthetase